MRQRTGRRVVRSVFFGGGTPSLMGAAGVARVLADIQDVYGLPVETEVTVECNPTSSSDALFAGLADVGVNRVSVGIQSLQDDLLKFLGREHTAEYALHTLKSAQNRLGNVNADVIYGLPNQQLEGWMDDLERVADLGLNHISCYQLTIEPQTHFFSAVKRGLWEPLDMDRQADFMAETAHFLGTQGFINYEISNFCKPTRECQHNLHVWQYHDYAGVGAGAHGRLTLTDGTRVATQMTKHPRNYLKHSTVDERLHTTVVTPQDAWREAILSGLRLKEGIDVPTLEMRLGGKLTENVSGEALAVLSRLGFLEHNCNRLRLTERGWLLLDSVVGQLLAD